jgi:hypothetical protein
MTGMKIRWELDPLLWPPARPYAEHPGALVFVLLDGEGAEVEVAWAARALSTTPAMAHRHAHACLADPDKRVVVYDGDTGEPILRLRVRAS